MPIVAADSVSGFFQEVVEDALKARRVEATDGTTNYLVAMLADYARPTPEALVPFGREETPRPLAFVLEEALHVPDPAERFERLRALGDGLLYSCGFFLDHFEARGLDQRYLFGIGTRAYGSASTMLMLPASETPDPPPIDIFGELATRFAVFVDVLNDVADSTIAMGSSNAKALLKVYERWLRTGSDRLAQALSSHGLVPTRGVKGTLH
jgi:hypothetical protein